MMRSVPRKSRTEYDADREGPTLLVARIPEVVVDKWNAFVLQIVRDPLLLHYQISLCSLGWGSAPMCTISPARVLRWPWFLGLGFRYPTHDDVVMF